MLESDKLKLFSVKELPQELMQATNGGDTFHERNPFFFENFVKTITGNVKQFFADFGIPTYKGIYYYAYGLRILKRNEL